MKKIKIYFWKHGFQTDGVSLWVVQCGKVKVFTKQVEILVPVKGKFSSKNPHAYFETISINCAMHIFGKPGKYRELITIEKINSFAE